jgi:hypothetical protein
MPLYFVITQTYFHSNFDTVSNTFPRCTEVPIIIKFSETANLFHLLPLLMQFFPIPNRINKHSDLLKCYTM